MALGGEVWRIEEKQNADDDQRRRGGPCCLNSVGGKGNTETDRTGSNESAIINELRSGDEGPPPRPPGRAAVRASDPRSWQLALLRKEITGRQAGGWGEGAIGLLGLETYSGRRGMGMPRKEGEKVCAVRYEGNAKEMQRKERKQRKQKKGRESDDAGWWLYLVDVVLFLTFQTVVAFAVVACLGRRGWERRKKMEEKEGKEGRRVR